MSKSMWCLNTCAVSFYRQTADSVPSIASLELALTLLPLYCSVLSTLRLLFVWEDLIDIVKRQAFKLTDGPYTVQMMDEFGPSLLWHRQRLMKSCNALEMS